MTIRWTKPANDDFLGIVRWIAADNRAAASRVGQRILDAVRQLDDFPLRGRPGRSPGTRELVISRLPYLVVYSVDPADPANGRDPPGAAWGHVVATGRALILLECGGRLKNLCFRAITFRGSSLPPNERSRGLALAGEVMRWLFTGKGMLTYSPSILAASANVLEECDPRCAMHLYAG